MNGALSASQQVPHLPIDTAQHTRKFGYPEIALYKIQNSQFCINWSVSITLGTFRLRQHRHEIRTNMQHNKPGTSEVGTTSHTYYGDKS